MATTKKNPKHVDYEKDIAEFMQSGADKVNKAKGAKEKMRNMPEAATKIAAGTVAMPFGVMAAKAVNKYKDVSENKKEPSIYSSTAGAKKFREEQNEIKRESRGMKAGGFVRAADGCAKKGKTKGKMV